MAKEKFPLKPLYLYAIIGVFILAFVSTAFFSISITGFATAADGNGISAPAEASETESTPEPSCADNCGRPCWLAAGGEEPGTFESSQGRIGILGCNGFCYEIKQSVDELLCCSHSDCPSDAPVCSSEGRCSK